MKLLVVAALAATAFLPNSASASCRPLVVDTAGDESPSDPSLDLLSADLDATTSRFAVVVELGGDAAASAWALGHSVEVVFRTGETRWNLSATFPGVGPAHAELGDTSSSGPTAPGTVRAGRSSRELMVSVPASAFTELSGHPLVPGESIYDVKVFTNRAAAVGRSGAYSPLPADVGSASHGYRVGSASCGRA